MAKRPVFSKQLVALCVVASLAVIAVSGWAVSRVITGSGSDNPFQSAGLYVAPDSKSALATAAATGAEKTAFESISSTPAAIWLLPEDFPTTDVGAYVSSVATTAAEQEKTPVFVVYGIPNRDCSQESAGGLTEAEYPGWVQAIADGLTAKKAVVILEPDSLALSEECGNTAERAAQVSDAVDRLLSPTLSVYLDGGHSNWKSVQVQADLLTAAGVGKVRGFATNVSNFNTTADEIAYNEQLSAQLGGKNYVIDTSRNGNGSNGEWCNPSGRALGDSPTAVNDGTALDALLWIKNPGESDGQCNGGPAAGEWWPEGAVALAR